MSQLERIQDDIGLRFANPSLLRRALTHRSYLNENPDVVLEDNQRLEFLGDAILDFVTAVWLYNRFPEYQEGPLTSLRAALVCTGTLARFARQIGIDTYLLLGKGEEEGGGRTRDSVLCDAFEALVGALYLDSGLAVVEALLHRLLPGEAERVLEERLDRDPKSLFQEWSQAQLGVTPRYRTVSATGPDHARTFVVEVLVADQVYGRGQGRSKQAAAQQAAQAGLDKVSGG